MCLSQVNYANTQHLVQDQCMRFLAKYTYFTVELELLPISNMAPQHYIVLKGKLPVQTATISDNFPFKMVLP